MKRKSIINFLLIISLLFTVAYAQEDVNYNVKNQWYKVTYDEVDTATVYVIFDIFNQDFNEKSLNSFKIQENSNKIELLEIVQEENSNKRCSQVCVASERVCVNSQVICNNFNKETNECLSWSEECQSYSTSCSQYEERCTTSNYYNNKNYNLLNINDVTKEGSIYEIPINAIQPGGSSRVMIKYKLKDSVSSFIYKRFSFESLILPVDTENIRISIVVDDNLQIAGVESKRIFGGLGFVTSEASVDSLNSIRIEDTSDYGILFNRITGFYGGQKEERTNLESGQTLMVEGKYSSNKLLLHIFEILFFFIVLIGSLYLWSRKTKSLAKNNENNLDSEKLKELKNFHMWRSIGFSFIGIFLFTVFLILSGFISNSYFKSIIVAFSFISMIGTLIYVKRIHSTKEMLSSIGFFFLWLFIVPFILSLLFFAILILPELFYFF